MTKYTLITGASGGLGKAFAVECAQLGHNLIITDLNKEKLKGLSKTLKSTYSIDVIYFACDLTNIHQRQSLFAKIQKLNVELFLTINVAGLDYEGGLKSLTSDMISTIIRLNTEATLDITRFAASQKHSGNYYIINVASMAGFFSMPLKAIYAASKRAIIQFSIAIREEIKSSGGHVMALCPSGLRTMPKVIASIESQGFFGRITTVNTGTVAHKTIIKAMRGQAKYVPGIVNILAVLFASIIPECIKTKIIFKRWEATRKKAVNGL